MFILRSSKTHSKGNKPQIVKISSKETIDKSINDFHWKNNVQLPCPYSLLGEYSRVRKPCESDAENFFVFRDGSPVTATDMRKCLKKMPTIAGFDQRLYSLHSLRSGRMGDLFKLGLPIDKIKQLGHWKSNAVFRYLRYS